MNQELFKIRLSNLRENCALARLGCLGLRFDERVFLLRWWNIRAFVTQILDSCVQRQKVHRVYWFPWVSSKSISPDPSVSTASKWPFGNSLGMIRYDRWNSKCDCFTLSKPSNLDSAEVCKQEPFQLVFNYTLGSPAFDVVHFFPRDSILTAEAPKIPHVRC
jgi:hypothetical protein